MGVRTSEERPEILSGNFNPKSSSGGTTLTSSFPSFPLMDFRSFPVYPFPPSTLPDFLPCQTLLCSLHQTAVPLSEHKGVLIR